MSLPNLLRGRARLVHLSVQRRRTLHLVVPSIFLIRRGRSPLSGKGKAPLFRRRLTEQINQRYLRNLPTSPNGRGERLRRPLSVTLLKIGSLLSIRLRAALKSPLLQRLEARDRRGLQSLRYLLACHPSLYPCRRLSTSPLDQSRRCHALGMQGTLDLPGHGRLRSLPEAPNRQTDQLLSFAMPATLVYLVRSWQPVIIPETGLLYLRGAVCADGLPTP
jgi:hypothetical protein